ISKQPHQTTSRVFVPPDLEFGQGAVLSVRGTPSAIATTVDSLGAARLATLYDAAAGPFSRQPLDQQYILVPQSSSASYGPAFLADLVHEVNTLYPQEFTYDPIIIPYDDQGPKTFEVQGKAILRSLENAALSPGYGIVMVHETSRHRQHDQLAAMLMHKLR